MVNRIDRLLELTACESSVPRHVAIDSEPALDTGDVDAVIARKLDDFLPTENNIQVCFNIAE